MKGITAVFLSLVIAPAAVKSAPRYPALEQISMNAPAAPSPAVSKPTAYDLGSAPKRMSACAHATVWSGAGDDGGKQEVETQLRKGEPVLLREEKGDWARIEAVEQLEFTHNKRWEGYPGWVRRSDLCESRGTGLRDAVADKSARSRANPDAILAAAEQFLGDPYFWGGVPESGGKQGIDCSGLVFYSYRANGMLLPRDAHEQWMKARPIRADEMRKGDLIFSGKPDGAGGTKITHVMMYISEDYFIEATGGTVRKTRKATAMEKFGASFRGLRSGDAAAGTTVYFGSFLH